MAQSTTTIEKQSRKIWKAVLIGAAVPVMMLAAAPAVSAAETETVQSESEQLPLPLPDPGAPVEPPAGDDLVTQLGECVAALVSAVVGATGDAPVPLPAEQVPDLSACTALLTSLGLPIDPPVDLPLPKEQ
jgi:hypothetical protein